MEMLPKFKGTEKDTSNRNVAYKIECKKCEDVYAGQTKQELQERKKHQYAINKKDIKASALVEHWAATGHKDFDMSNTKILAREPKTKKRLVKEAFHIRKERKVMNRKEERGSFDSIYYNIPNIWR